MAAGSGIVGEGTLSSRGVGRPEEARLGRCQQTQQYVWVVWRGGRTCGWYGGVAGRVGGMAGWQDVWVVWRDGRTCGWYGGVAGRVGGMVGWRAGGTWREEGVRPTLLGRDILKETESRGCGSHCYQCNQITSNGKLNQQQQQQQQQQQCSGSGSGGDGSGSGEDFGDGSSGDGGRRRGGRGDGGGDCGGCWYVGAGCYGGCG